MNLIIIFMLLLILTSILSIAGFIFLMISFGRKTTRQKEMIELNSNKHGNVFEDSEENSSGVYVIGSIKEIIKDERRIRVNNKPLCFVIVKYTLNNKTYENSFSKTLNFYLDKRWNVDNLVPLYINYEKKKVEYVSSKEKFIREYQYSIPEEKLDLMYPPYPYKRLFLILGSMLLIPFIIMFIVKITEFYK